MLVPARLDLRVHPGPARRLTPGICLTPPFQAVPLLSTAPPRTTFARPPAAPLRCVPQLEPPETGRRTLDRQAGCSRLRTQPSRPSRPLARSEWGRTLTSSG